MPGRGRTYAEDTTVPAARSVAEIIDLLRKAGAAAVVQGWDDKRNLAALEFDLGQRRIRFVLPLPSRSEDRFRFGTGAARYQARTPESGDRLHEQAVRQRWRALLLIIKAKLAAIEAGIVTVEDEFLAQTVLPDGRTVSEYAQPAITEAYASGSLPQLLPGTVNHG